MAARKSREQEEFEAFERAKRAFERKLDDIAWKHEEFFPRLNAFLKGELDKKGKPKLELGE